VRDNPGWRDFSVEVQDDILDQEVWNIAFCTDFDPVATTWYSEITDEATRMRQLRRKMLKDLKNAVSSRLSAARKRKVTYFTMGR